MRADILAGRAVVIVDIQDMTDKALRDLRTKFRVFQSAVSEVGGDLFRGGLFGTAGSIFPVKAFADFQDQVLFLRTKLPEASKEMLQEVENYVRKLGRTTSFSPQEVARGATILAEAGFSAKEVMDALLPSLDLARAAQVELETTTAILTGALRAFGADSSQAAEYASKFATAIRLGTLDIVDLNESLKYSQGTFATFGTSFEETLALITNLSNVSTRGTMAGTSLQTAFQNLSSEADKLNEILGVTLTDMDFVHPIQALEKMEKALAGMTNPEKVNALREIANIRGARGISGEFLAGLVNLKKITKALQESSDEARKASTMMDSRLGGSLRRTISAFQDFEISIGSTSEGPLSDFLTKSTGVLNSLNELSVKFPKISQGLLLLGPAALVGGLGLLTLSTIAAKLVILLGPLISLNALLFKGLANIVGLNIKQLSSVGNAFKFPIAGMSKQLNAVTAAQLKYNAAQKALRGNITASNAKKAATAYANLQKAMNASMWTRQYSFINGVNSVVNVLNSSLSRLIATYRQLTAVATTANIATSATLPRTGALATGAGSSLLGNPASKFAPANFSLPMMNSAFRMRAAGSNATRDNQLSLPLQFELDFGDKEASDLFKQLPRLKNGAGKFISENFITAAIDRGIEMSRLKLYRGYPMRFMLEDLFTTMDVSPSAVRTIEGRVAEALRSMNIRPDNQLTFAFNDVIEQAARRVDIQPLLNLTSAPELPNNLNDLLGMRDILDERAKDLYVMQKRVNLTPGFAPVPKPPIGGKGAFAARQAAITNATTTPNTGPKILDSIKSVIPRIKDLFKFPVTTIIDHGDGTFDFLDNLLDDGPKRMGLIERGMLGIGSSVARAGTGLWEFIKGVNWLGKIVSVVKGIGTAFKLIFTVLNTIRRTVFSLSGILTIFEVLILFGDKIPLINTGLERLGSAVSGFFSNLGRTFGNLGTVFGYVRQGIDDIMSGNGEQGVARLKGAFTGIANIIRGGLTLAWQNFTASMQPAIDMIHNLWIGLSNVLNVLIEIVGTNIGTIFKNAGNLFAGGSGGIGQILGDVFSPEGLQQIFGVIIAVVKEVGLFINKMIAGIFSVLDLLKQAVLALLQALSILPGEAGKSAQQGLNKADANYGKRIELLDEIDTLKREMLELPKEMVVTPSTSYGAAPTISEFRSPENQALFDAYAAEILNIEAELAKLGPAFGSIAYNMEEGANVINSAAEKAMNELYGMNTTPAITQNEQVARDAAYKAALDAANEFGGGVTNPLQDYPVMDIAAEELKKSQEAALAGKKDEIDRLGLMIDKALVTSVEDSRNTLRIAKNNKMEKLAEKTLTVEEDIEGHLAKLNDSKQPFVFG